MGYPADIIHLVFNYLIKPSYILDGPLAKLLGLKINRAITDPEILAQLAKNPRALGRNCPVKYYKLMDLAKNSSPEINKIIWNYPIDSIMNGHGSSDLPKKFIKKLSCNQYAKPTIDTLFMLYPGLLDMIDLTISGFAENPALSTQIINKYGDKRLGSYILENPSNDIFDKYIINAIPQPAMLRNLNSRAIERGVSSGYISHFVNGKFSYLALPDNDKGWLVNFLSPLLENQSEVAGRYFNQVLGNITDASIDPNLMVKIFNNSYKIFINPADWAIDILEKYLPKLSAQINNNKYLLASNPNPRAVKLFFSFCGIPSLLEKANIASNPGAIEQIRTNPELFRGIPELYSNPEIFKSGLDKNLIKKLEWIFFI